MHTQKISKLLIPLVALALALSMWGVGPSQPTQAAATRIMPLGDSITGGPGCWRALLWNQLQNAGYTNIDFVGTLPAQGCSVAHDGNNEGHSGYLATDIADQNLLPGWLAATNPDIVMLHLGTNDVWNNRAPSVIVTAFSKLVDQMRANNPNVKILVAKIIPMNPSGCPDCGQRAINLNNAIPAWAAGKTTAQSPISVVDQWTGFNTATDTYDGVHPSSAGDQKMANQWFPALTALLNGATPTRTATPPPTTPAVCPVLTIAPLLVEPVASPTNLLEQEIVVPVYTSQQVTVKVESESGAFSVVGNFSTTNPARVTIPLFANTTHHLTVSVIIPPWTTNGCSYSGYTLTATKDRNQAPLTIVQGTPLPTTETPPQSNACKVDYTVNQWGNGFTANIKITNISATPVQGWTLAYSYANGQQITSSWNATVSQSGANVTASNPASHWNGTIPANGGSVSFGVQGTHGGTNTSPANFTLNNVVCNDSTVTVTPPTGTPTPTATATVSTATPTPTATATVSTITPTTQTPTSTATATHTATPVTPVAGGCQVAYTANSWGNGFTTDVKISNGGSSAIQGWTLAYSYANGQQITSSWNATVSQSGANVTASNPASHWNGMIAANGGSVSFGIQGTHGGTNSAPTNFTLNGTPCNGEIPPTQATLVASSTPSATPVVPTSIPPTTSPGAYTGNATYFDALGMPYGGCGITQSALDSQNFVALNVQDTPGDYTTMFPRPITPDHADQIGMFNNGLNCGRWIRVNVGDYCNGINDGAPNAGFCHDGSWISDAYNGATLDFIVADSCQDSNGWCRDDRYHIDLAKASLNLFVKDGLPVGDLFPNHWNNRQMTWEFIEAPGYSGDINIGFLKDAQTWWTPIGITHLQNGIHGVDYEENGAWVKANMNADMGQSYLIRPTSDGGSSYRIRVYDADDQLINNGRIYNFSLPASCSPQCSPEFTPVSYTVE